MSKLTIKAGKYYKTRNGKKAYCVAVALPSPDGFSKYNYPVLVATDNRKYTTTLKGFYCRASSPSDNDIVSEWIEPVVTRTFKSPKQLVKALLKGQKWVCEGYNNYCYWDTKYNCFNIGVSIMDSTWKYADGKTIWTRVKD